MLSAMLFCRDRAASAFMGYTARESQQVCVYKTMHTFPSPYELTRLLNTFTPDVVLIELSQLEEALLLVRGVRVVRPQAAVIGFGLPEGEGIEGRAFLAGVTEILAWPATCREFQTTVETALQKARPAVQDNLFAFLPAKAGSGSSTVAVNVAGRLAGDLEQKVLVVDADLRSGILAELLQLRAEYSVAHALENADRLDGTLWTRVVTRAHGLDFLPALRANAPALFSWAHYRQLLQFVRPRYDSVVVDLPEVVNDATVEIVRRASRVFVVCTAELPSLLLARQRTRELAGRLANERVEIILNRWNRHDTQLAEIEEFLDRPVAAAFHNDYHSVHRAIQEGRLVGPRSELGRSFTGFARELAGLPRPQRRFGFLGALLAGSSGRPASKAAEVEAAVDVQHLAGRVIQ